MLLRLLGNDYIFLCSRHWNKCLRSFICSNVNVFTSLPAQTATAKAISKRPQSIVPRCCWTDNLSILKKCLSVLTILAIWSMVTWLSFFEAIHHFNFKLCHKASVKHLYSIKITNTIIIQLNMYFKNHFSLQVYLCATFVQCKHLI